MQAEKRTIIFSDSLEVGKAIANRFKVPFVSGETKNNMETIVSNRIVVVSRVGDEGMSLPDIEQVIEVSWLEDLVAKSCRELLVFCIVILTSRKTMF